MGQDTDALHKFGPFYEYAFVERWGRVDDRIVSFALRHGSLCSGEQMQYSPIMTENILVRTGEPVSIDAVVVGRSTLLATLAAVFRADYPEEEPYLRTQDIERSLAAYHTEADWQTTFCWMLDENNDLVVFYNPYDLVPAAAAAFVLTVRRDAFPEVFRSDFGA